MNQARRPPGTLIFGAEHEYAFAALGADGGRLDPDESVEVLMGEVIRQVPHLQCGGPHDVFTVNGSRVYLDVGHHPEVATPECSTPEEAVCYSRAGDQLLARGARSLERNWGSDSVEAMLWKGNVDHRSGATWASHESYLHQAPQSLLAKQLMTHLVTRILYTGAGGFNNRATMMQYVVSPRAFHLEHAISHESTHGRGIFHTRDEPLAMAPYRRLHVLAGESLWSQTADYLRFGTTALLIAQIDAGRRPQAGLDLASPLQALATIAADVSCTATAQLRPSGHLTAIALQRRLLENVEADLGADHLPSWAPSVCERWRAVLDRLEASPSSLVGVLDWPTKLAVLRRQCEAEGIEWSFSDETGAGLKPERSSRGRRAKANPATARLLETDMHFNRLDERGIFASLDREGALSHSIVSPDAIERALGEPPSAGRARIRGACVKRLAGQGAAISCNWSRIVDHDKHLELSLADPFQSDGETWTPISRGPENLLWDLDPDVAPITLAVAAGTPAQALLEMRRLLSGPEPPSLSVCRYCVTTLQSLVPTAPVPVLHRGAATAGPVLSALFEHVIRLGQYSLMNKVGTLLYRFHESRGRYADARQVIGRLLEHGRVTGNPEETAHLTNNLGYVYLLEGQWVDAEAQFEQAKALFDEIGVSNEALNVRANLLECRVARTDPEHWDALLPTLRDLNRALVANHDWRRRKTLRLLARVAAHRGRLPAARGWARRAMAASRGYRTRLREWDRAYLRSLEADTAPPPDSR